MTTTFTDLADFITNRMRMSHVYQPAMLIALLRSGGVATIQTIAREFLAEDRSQGGRSSIEH
jgi:ATP adenylyltransferase